MFKVFRRIRHGLLTNNKFSKYLFYAIGEIILVVIGILIALQVNNWNNTRLNKDKVNHYSKLLIEDLSNDIRMIKVSQFQATKSFNRIDSLKSYMSLTTNTELSNTDLFILTHDIMYRPYKWNRSTLDEMKSSEILQYFNNDSLKSKLIAYESFSYHLDEDFQQDVTNSRKAEDMIRDILDLNNPYFDDMLMLESERFNDPELNLFETNLFRSAKDEEVFLISNDINDLKRFTNTFIIIQDAYRIRAFLEMKDIMEDAEEIIQLLRKEIDT